MFILTFSIFPTGIPALKIPPDPDVKTTFSVDISLEDLKYCISPWSFPLPDNIDWTLPGSIITGILLFKSEINNTLEVE